MNYISKTYSLSEDVVARLDALREQYGSVNKALTIVLPIIGEVIPEVVDEVPAADPVAISGVVRGAQNLLVRPARESSFERGAREKREREDRARSRSSVGDDPDMDFSDEYVSG
jgi:hypothetical protein